MYFNYFIKDSFILYYAQSKIACIPFAQSRKRNQKRFSGSSFSVTPYKFTA